MHILIEQWRYRAAWLMLSEVQRADFLAKVGQSMIELEKAGVTTLGWGDIDQNVDHAAPYDFVALWQAESETALDFMLDQIRQSGWYDYFEHHNIRSTLVMPPVILKKHVLAETIASD